MTIYPIRKRLRISQYNYSQPGYYFVTICKASSYPGFTELTGNLSILRQSGIVINNCWQRIPDRFPGVYLDEFVIMPNHFHGIIIISDETKSVIPLGKIIAYFKYASTKNFRLLGGVSFGRLWQRGYHDHVIRNETDLKRIREYIQNNPRKWHLDRYFDPSI